MKHSIPSALFFFLAASSLPAAAAPLQAGTGLDEIRKTFAAADRNADGTLDPAEAKRATIPSADFLSQDHDNDRKLSEDEFLLYYRELLVGAKQTVAPDVEREAARITDARAKRAAEAEQRRKAEAARREAAAKQADQKNAPVVLSKNVSEKLKRAEAALDSMVARGALTPAEADAKRNVLRQRAEAVSGRSRARAQAEQAQGAKSGAGGEVDVEKRFRRAEDALEQASGEGKLTRAEGQEQRNKLAERARNAQADANRTERDKLDAELKQLDVDLAAGRLSKADYESKRNALIERGQRADKVGGTQDAQNGDARARGEAARKQHQDKQAEAEKQQKRKERAEAARRQRQETEAQRAERERLQREKQEAAKQRAERERLQRQREAAEKHEAEKRRKDAERRKRAQQDAERKRKAREDAGRKQP